MLHKLLFLSLLALFCGACSSYYYAPNTLHTPHLLKRHDAQLSGAGLMGVEFSGFEMHGSYALTNRLALMVNHVQMNGGDRSSDRWGRGRLTEGALGTYFPVGDATSNSLFLGWGDGYALNRYPSNSKAELRFNRYFGQLGVSVERSVLRMGIATRFNYLQYRSGRIDYRLGEPHISVIEQIEETSPIFFPEFGFSIGLGTNPIAINAFLNRIEYARAEELGMATYTMGISFSFKLDYLWRPEHTSRK